MNLCMINIKASRKTRKFDDYFPEWRRDSYYHHQLVEEIGGIINISGLRNLHQLNQPTVFIANHMSSMEAFLLPAIILPFTQVTYVIKTSLLKYPLLGTILRRVEAVAVSRSNPKDDLKKVFEGAGSMLKNGRSIIIFPQKTRSTELDPDQFSSIGIKLARKLNAPVVPIALKTDMWRNGRILKDFGPLDVSREVYFEFGKPFHVKSNGKNEHENVISFIKSRLNDWNSK